MFVRTETVPPGSHADVRSQRHPVPFRNNRRSAARFSPIIPERPDRLAVRFSEAVETATGLDGYRYVLGSVLNQVLLHQSVIGLEAKAALDKYNVVPDLIIGCAGGGSNLGGLISPFMGPEAARRTGLPFHRGRTGVVPVP